MNDYFDEWKVRKEIENLDIEELRDEYISLSFDLNYAEDTIANLKQQPSTKILNFLKVLLTVLGIILAFALLCSYLYIVEQKLDQTEPLKQELKETKEKLNQSNLIIQKVIDKQDFSNQDLKYILEALSEGK